MLARSDGRFPVPVAAAVSPTPPSTWSQLTHRQAKPLYILKGRRTFQLPSEQQGRLREAVDGLLEGHAPRPQPEDAAADVHNRHAGEMRALV